MMDIFLLGAVDETCAAYCSKVNKIWVWNKVNTASFMRKLFKHKSEPESDFANIP